MRQLFKQANQELNLAGFLRLDAGCFIGGSAAICDPACPLTCGLAPGNSPASSMARHPLRRPIQRKSPRSCGLA
jgi:hypothetical protein